MGDHLGSTSLVLDAGGNEIGHAIYDAYGQLVENTIPLTLTDRLYTGQIFDASSGLYYYNARYYDPLTGQFTQPDSLIPDPLNPMAWNRFSYVYGNPANYTDPSGHFPWWDLLDIASFGLSLNDFIQDPSLANAGWLALDTISLLPVIPAYGSIRHAGKLGLSDNAARAAGRIDSFSPSCAINSFTAGTLVHTETGLVPIEAIRVGDKVYTQDPATGESGYFEVVALFSHPVEEILHLTIDDDGSDPLPAEVMAITPNHPVYVEGKGWVEAEDLSIGDRLRRADGGWAKVLAIERLVLDEPVVVYNFTVKGIHTYFVLEVGVLVHNCGDPIWDANVQRWRDPQTGRFSQSPDILDRASIRWSQNAVSDDVFWVNANESISLAKQ